MREANIRLDYGRVSQPSNGYAQKTSTFICKNEKNEQLMYNYYYLDYFVLCFFK